MHARAIVHATGGRLRRVKVADDGAELRLPGRGVCGISATLGPSRKATGPNELEAPVTDSAAAVVVWGNAGAARVAVARAFVDTTFPAPWLLIEVGNLGFDFYTIDAATTLDLVLDVVHVDTHSEPVLRVDYGAQTVPASLGFVRGLPTYTTAASMARDLATEATQLANKAFLAEIADDLPAKGPANANAAMPVTLATNDAQAAALLAQLTQIAAEVSPLAAAPPGIVRTTVGTTAATLASAPCSRGFWLVCHYDSPGVLWYGAASAGVTSSGSNARGHLVPGDRKWFGLDNPSRLEVCGSAAATAYSIDGE